MPNPRAANKRLTTTKISPRKKKRVEPQVLSLVSSSPRSTPTPPPNDDPDTVTVDSKSQSVAGQGVETPPSTLMSGALPVVDVSDETSHLSGSNRGTRSIPPANNNSSPNDLKDPRPLESKLRPPASETWQIFGDNRSTEYLQSTTTMETYQVACRYFHARLALVSRGFTIEDLKTIFQSCLPSFLKEGEDYDRRVAFEVFEAEHEWVEARLMDRFRGYANLWLQSPGGLDYKQRHQFHSRKTRKVSCRAPPIPNHESITTYDGQKGIDWSAANLIDVWLPCLAAVKTEQTGRDNEIGWIMDPDNLWRESTETLTFCIIIDLSKLLVRGCQDEFFRPALRKIFRSYLAFHLDSPEFGLAKELLIVKDDSMRTPLDLTHLNIVTSFDDLPGPLDPTLFIEDPMGVTAREEKEMADELLAGNGAMIREEERTERELLARHAREVANIQRQSSFRFAQQNLLSLRTPVVAAEEESALAKAYAAKGPIGRIRHVKEETRLERERLMAHATQAVRRINALDKELVLLDEQEELRASAEESLLAQLSKHREKEALIKKKRGALRESQLFVPSLPQHKSSHIDEQEVGREVRDDSRAVIEALLRTVDMEDV